jgi:plasmid stabilization system protein ParE
VTPVRWTPQALEDVAGIRDFIARDAPGYAGLVVDRIFESVERLHQSPQSGRIVPEFEEPDLREVLLGVYRIVYRVTPKRVSILTVYHSARLLGPSDLPAV